MSAERGVVQRALDRLHRRPALPNDPQNLAHIGELFRRTHRPLSLHFRQLQRNRRIAYQLRGGLLTIGAAPDPFITYAGPTGRRAPMSGRAVTEPRKQCGNDH
jgi:hypothetical protein